MQVKKGFVMFISNPSNLRKEEEKIYTTQNVKLNSANQQTKKFIYKRVKKFPPSKKKYPKK